jgi:hypothetical protein
MKGTLRILFVDESTWTADIIKGVTGGEWSHCGVLAFDGLVEAVPPRATISSARRYQCNRTEILEIEVPDINAALAEAKSLSDESYSLPACISGGIHDIFNIQVCINDDAVNCCGLVIRVIRAGGGIVAPAIGADCFTPQRLYAEIKLANQP